MHLAAQIQFYENMRKENPDLYKKEMEDRAKAEKYIYTVYAIISLYILIKFMIYFINC